MSPASAPRRLINRRPLALALLASAALALSACAVGPNYRRPTVSTPAAFKEAEGWKQAEPSDAVSRQDWWRVFDDPVLNDLEAKVLVSNQTLAQSEAAYRQAVGVLQQQRASLFPTVNLSGSGSQAQAPSGFYGAGGEILTGAQAVDTYSTSFGLTWDVDVWGRIRRTIEAAHANAQASAADLANATLSAQALLAADYFQLREADEEKRLIDQTVKGYADDLRINQSRFQAGTNARSDVLSAQTQLKNAQAQAVDLVRTRALLEHQIAVLAGRTPAELTIAPAAWNPTVPAVPVSMPSNLLERRPDIAGAERRVKAANAQVGVNVAGYFPDLSVSGLYGFTSTDLTRLVTAGSNEWSIGGTAAETLLDFGANHARVKQARAAYDAAVANYRQTVLSAFQQVEDNIAALRVLQAEYDIDVSSSKDADENETLTSEQYQTGAIDYTTVVVAQNTALAARTAVLQTARSRLVAMVDLVQDLGGGWNAAQLARK